MGVILSRKISQAKSSPMRERSHALITEGKKPGALGGRRR